MFFIDAFNQFNDFMNGIIWGVLLVPLLLGVGLFFTIATGFIQVRFFPHMWRALFQSSQSEGGISSFQAFSTSLAARVGTGNLMGVAAALSVGGPGALFWMWMTALVGMSTAFIESTLGQYFKQPHQDGSFRGGPAYYIEKGLGQRWLSILFSICLILSFGIGFNALQANTIVDATANVFGATDNITTRFLFGILLVLLAAPVIFGGMKSIAKIAGILVPFMAVAYLILAVIVLFANMGSIIPAFKSIFTHAFGLEPAVGGVVGYAVKVALQQGVRRGLFSNEAGMGSAPNAAASADAPHPAVQGMVQAVGVFIDTIVICSATGLIIILSGLLTPGMDIEGITLTQEALGQTLGSFATIAIAVIIFFFSYTSIIANYSYSETNIEYIVGKENSKNSIFILRVFVLFTIVIASVVSLSSIFNFADVAMGLMAIINLIAIVLLSPLALRLYKDYQQRLKSGNPMNFSKGDINYPTEKTHPDVWN